jgi:hypothetical protein
MTKCTCESMNPGVTIPPFASTTRAAPSFRISAEEPTATIVSPFTAIASAHGLAESPVQTLALTMASEALDSLDIEHAVNARIKVQSLSPMSR